MKIILLAITFILNMPIYADKRTKIDPQKILASAKNMDKEALSYAIKGYHYAQKKGEIKNPNVLTLIDFNKPSNKKRLWVIDLKKSKIMLNTYTTHGKNSGMKVATRFSNRNGTNQTSLGVYKTLYAYRGKHGLSLRVKGLEKGINDNAYNRAIVFHPAWYATNNFVKANHRAGRSWGCFAIAPTLSKKLVNLTKNGSVVYAYAKQEKSDPFLQAV